MCLPAKVHHVGDEPHVDTIEKIAMALFSLFVLITDTAQIYLAHTMLDKPVDSLFQIAFLEVPIAGEIIHGTIWYDAQRNLVTHLLLFLHQTIDSIVQSRIATHHNDGLVTIMDKHGHKSFHTVSRLALHEIVLNLAFVQCFLDSFSLLVVMSFGTIQYAPSVLLHCFPLS